MTELVLHTQTRQQLDRVVKRPSHAILLSGPVGIGKASVASWLAGQLLAIEPDKLSSYPYIRFVRPEDRKAISIEQIRGLEHFLALKIPGSKPVARIAVIEDAQAMTPEAQNALLKTLEEPPADTVLLLTTAHAQALLPTIRSRLQLLDVKKPKTGDLDEHFRTIGTDSEISQAMAISGGLPGLMAALLDKTVEHPLTEAVGIARELLQTDAYARLLRVDELSKRKDLSQDVCYVLMQMAHTALANGAPAPRWQRVLRAAYDAKDQLQKKGQPKLVLTNLMLQL